MGDDPIIEQIENLKSSLFMFMILVPLVAALFAERIDNLFIACLLFVTLIGTAVFWLQRRFEILERSVKEMEEKLKESSSRLQSESDDDLLPEYTERH